MAFVRAAAHTCDFNFSVRSAAAVARKRLSRFVCRWVRDPASGALRCVWEPDPAIARRSTRHLRLVR